MQRSASLLAAMLLSAGCPAPGSAPAPSALSLPDAGSSVTPVEAASAAPASSAPSEAGPDADADVFTSSGCDRVFPATGTRFVDVTRQTLKLPKAHPSSFMIAENDDTTRRAVALLAVSGGEVQSARLTQEGWAQENGGTRWAIVERGDAGLANVTVNGPRGPLVAGATPAEEALITTAKDRTRLVTLLTGPIAGDAPVVTMGAESRDAQTLVYPVTVRGKTGSAATGHSLSEQLDLKGRLVLRVSDRALVELTLAGTDVMVEDAATGDGRTRVASPPVRGRVTFEVKRECFRPH